MNTKSLDYLIENALAEIGDDIFFDRVVNLSEQEASVLSRGVSYLDIIKDPLLKKGFNVLDFDSAVSLLSDLSDTPAPVKSLVDRLYEGHRIEAHDRKLVEYAYTTALAIHSLHRRKTREYYMTHPHSVARKLVEGGEDTTTVIAALLHDAIEERVKEELAKRRVSDNRYYDGFGVEIKWDELTPEERERYNRFGREIRRLQSEGLEPLLTGFVNKLIPEDQRPRYLEEAKRASMIVELLTRIEGRPWFEHVDRLVSIPNGEDLEIAISQGYYMKGPSRYDERIMSAARKIKLVDKIANTETSTGFSPEARLIDAFKNLYILGRVKSSLTKDTETFEQTGEYGYHKELLDMTIKQLKSIAGELRKYPMLLLKTPFYLIALGVYSRKYQGLSRVTKKGEVKARWWEKLLLYGRPLEHFDGTLARYASIGIYKFEPGMQGVATERQQYKDALLFLKNARRFKDPKFVFDFFVPPEIARDYANVGSNL